MFSKGGFSLRKWKTSDEAALENVPAEFRDKEIDQEITEDDRFTKVLGIEWNCQVDAFRPRIAPITADKPLTKRTLVSEIAKFYDVLGWCSPVTIKIKILLQRLRKFGVD